VGETAEFEVGDTGIGIRDDNLEAIWEDFRQVDQSITREFGGTGLGLSITRKLVEALGGGTQVVSEYGKGSTFSVILPIRSTPAEGDVQIPSGGSRGSGGRGGANSDRGNAGLRAGEFAPPSPS